MYFCIINWKSGWLFDLVKVTEDYYNQNDWFFLSLFLYHQYCHLRLNLLTIDEPKCNSNNSSPMQLFIDIHSDIDPWCHPSYLNISLMRMLCFFCDSSRQLDASKFVRDHSQRLNSILIMTISICCHSLQMSDRYGFPLEDPQLFNRIIVTIIHLCFVCVEIDSGMKFLWRCSQ